MNKLIKQAFTLIELLVVIAIIGILSGLIVVSMSGVTQKANIAKGQVFSNSLKNSLMLNIIAEWKFDDGSGQSAIDSWGDGNNCTLGSTTGTDTNDPTWITSGCVYGSCLSFDGSDDYLICGTGSNLNLTDSITISAWIYPNKEASSTSAYHIVGKMGTWRVDGYDFRLGNGGSNVLQFVTGAMGDDVNGTTLLQKNTWYHVVAVQNGTTFKKIYLNGVQDGIKNSPTALISSSASLKIGVSPSLSERFNGSIDDIRVYNSTILLSKIKEQYYIGLNSLLTNGNITKEEYASRISEVSFK